jgi:hypothetical protein
MCGPASGQKGATCTGEQLGVGGQHLRPSTPQTAARALQSLQWLKQLQVCWQQQTAHHALLAECTHSCCRYTCITSCDSFLNAQLLLCPGLAPPPTHTHTQVCPESQHRRLDCCHCGGMAGVHALHAVCHVPVLPAGGLLHSRQLQAQGGAEARVCECVD